MAFENLIKILELESLDLKELAQAAGGDIESFYDGIDFAGIDLRGQDLSSFRMKGAKLRNAQYDGSTKFSETVAAKLSTTTTPRRFEATERLAKVLRDAFQDVEEARRLAERLGTPEAERDLAIALDKLGDAAITSGDHTAARAAYDESLEIARHLSARMGTPEAERDLSVSLEKVGDAASVAGDHGAARAAYQESLDIRRRLSARLGTPEAERDLSVSLFKVTRAAIVASDRDGARAYHQEGVAQIARLHEIHKAEMQSAFDNLAARIEAME